MRGASRKRVVVVGGGVAGAATAWALADAGGAEVTLLEQEPQLGAHSTGRNAGILRTLTEAPATTALALETAAFLSAPPAGFSPVPLLDPVGLVLVPAAGSGARLAAWRARKPEGSVLDLDATALARLLPPYRGALEGAVLARDEGVIDTAALLEGLVRGARERGVRVRTGARVTGLELAHGAEAPTALLAGGERLGADAVVIAAGGWAGALARAAGSPLEFQPRLRHLLVTAPEARIDRRWPVVWSEPDGFYARPESGGLLLCACDEAVVAPEDTDARPEVLERVAGVARRCLAGFDDAPAAHFWAGLRTFSADDAFAVGPDPEVRGLWWAAGLGGHGMSTSIGVGRLAAARLLGLPHDAELARALDPARLVAAGRA
jgi:D-arginine dehydrogenase